MAERELWSEEDELGYQIGDMNGEWEDQEVKDERDGELKENGKQEVKKE